LGDKATAVIVCIDKCDNRFDDMLDSFGIFPAKIHLSQNLFQEMFLDSLVDIILFQTNLYAQQAQKPYTPATKRELKTFLGLNI